MAEYCDNVVVMSHSEIFLSGSVEEVFYRADELSSVGLDIPQIMKIALRLKALGMPLSGKLYTVDGARDAILTALKGRGC